MEHLLHLCACYRTRLEPHEDDYSPGKDKFR